MLRIDSDETDELGERRRRAQKEEEEAVDEGEWDYAEQDDEILEDMGEDTTANLKSGREKTLEEVDEERERNEMFSEKVLFIVLCR